MNDVHSYPHIYPHMCREDHEEIGHRNSEYEMCPLCRAEAEVARLRTAIGEIIDRHRWRLMSDDPMLSDLAALRDGGPTR